ncbi:hypothetical protein [uncultured Chryseobacterium sp.]
MENEVYPILLGCITFALTFILKELTEIRKELKIRNDKNNNR